MSHSRESQLKKLIEESTVVSTLTDKITRTAFDENLSDEQKRVAIDRFLRDAKQTIMLMKALSYEAFRSS